MIKGAIMGSALSLLKHNNPVGLGGRYHWWIPFNRLLLELKAMDTDYSDQTIWAACRNLRDRGDGDLMLEFMVSNKDDNQNTTVTAYIRAKPIGMSIDERGTTLPQYRKGKGKPADSWKSWNPPRENAPAAAKGWDSFS